MSRDSRFQGVRSSTDCVLMFSGGRDSTLAALRLHEQGHHPVLVTVSSDHLIGIDAVRARLREISSLLPLETRWIRIRQPTGELQTDTSYYEKTCLPCHQAYVVVAVAVATDLNASTLAFGYTGYQSSWPEQTPLAVATLTNVLEGLGLRLLLPVYDVASRAEVIRELEGRCLSPQSLEQKCTQQVHNVALSNDRLVAQLAIWEQAIARSTARPPLLEALLIESTTLRGLREHG